MVNINNGKHWEMRNMNKHKHIPDSMYVHNAPTTHPRLTTASAIFFDHVPPDITNISRPLCLMPSYFISFGYKKC